MLLPQQLVTRLVNTGLLGDEKDIVYCGNVLQVKKNKKNARVLVVEEAAIYTFVEENNGSVKLSKTLNSKSMKIVERNEEKRQVTFSATLKLNEEVRKILTIELKDMEEYKELVIGLVIVIERFKDENKRVHTMKVVVEE